MLFSIVFNYLVALALQPWRAHKGKAEYAFCSRVVDLVEDNGIARQDALDFRFEEVAHDWVGELCEAVSYRM
jgi:hypothetical protein